MTCASCAMARLKDPCTTLVHEVAHAAQHDDGTFTTVRQKQSSGCRVGDNEIGAVAVENDFRRCKAGGSSCARLRCCYQHDGEASPCPLDSCTEGRAVVPATCGCGDGTVDAASGEECDDENTVDGDGCSSACKNECGALPSDAVVFWRLSYGQYAYVNNGSQQTLHYTDGIESTVDLYGEWSSTAADECMGSGVLRASSTVELTADGATSDLRADLRVERHWCVPGDAPGAGVSVNTGFMVGVPADSPNRFMRVPYVGSYQWTINPDGCLPYGIPGRLSDTRSSAFQAGGDYPCPGRPDLVCPERLTVFGDLGLTASLSAGLASANAIVTDCAASATGHFKVRMCPDRTP